MYEKDGQPAEVILRNVIRVKFLWPGRRPYKTENLYEIMEKEAHQYGDTPNPGVAAKNKTAAKAAVSKCPAGKKQ
jgi:hypothetical protein